MACIEVEQLQKIRLHQDDVLVVKLDSDVDASTQRAYEEILGRAFPDNKVVILQPGQSVEVVTNNSGAAATGPAEHPTADDRLLPPREAAEYLGVGPIALRDWRRLRIGPPYIRLGHRTVRYRKSDLDAWLEKQRVVGGAADDGPAATTP